MDPEKGPGEQASASAEKVKSAIWSSSDLDVLEFLVAKKARTFVFGWITIISAILAAGALIGWNGIVSIQDSLQKKADELDKQAKAIEEKSRGLDKAMDEKSSQLNDRFESLTKKQDSILNDFRDQQDRVVETFRQDERDIRHSADTTRESVFTAQQALLASQRELTTAAQKIQDDLASVEINAKAAKKAREDLETEVVSTKQTSQDILARVGDLERKIKEKYELLSAVSPPVKAGQGDYSQADGKIRHRPAMGGDSIGTRGQGALTLGCLVKDAKGDLYILTLIAENGSPGDVVMQPGPLDGGKEDADALAILTRDNVPAEVIFKVLFQYKIPTANRSALVFGSIAKVVDPSLVSPGIRGIGRLKGVAEARLGSTVRKVGRTTGLTTGRIVEVDASVEVAIPGGSVNLHHLIAVEPLSSPRMTNGGDSGSILVDEDNYAVGLSFAGSPSKSLFIPIDGVLKALGVSLVL